MSVQDVQKWQSQECGDESVNNNHGGCFQVVFDKRIIAYYAYGFYCYFRNFKNKYQCVETGKYVFLRTRAVPA